MEISYREKAFHDGKKIRKNDFAPSEKFSCYAPDLKLGRHSPLPIGYKWISIHLANIIWKLAIFSR